VYSWHEDGKVYLIVEYCSRGTLYDYLDSLGRLLTPDEAMLEDVASNPFWSIPNDRMPKNDMTSSDAVIGVTLLLISE